MKNKLRVVKQITVAEKPIKVEVTDEEFRRKLKDIKEWRKKHLAEIRTENPR